MNEQKVSLPRNKKKIAIISLLVLVPVVIIAFVFFLRQDEPGGTVSLPEEFAHLPVVPGMVQPGAGVAVAVGSEIDRELLFEDLDYFLYVLENNFCLIDVTDRAHGVDIRAAVENVRREIAANQNIGVDEFHALLWRYFHILSSGANLNFLSRALHQFFLDNPPVARWYFNPASLARLEYPHVLSRLESRPNFTEVESFAWQFMNMQEGAITEAVEGMGLPGERAYAAAELSQLISEGRYIDAGVVYYDLMREISTAEALVTTDIIEPGRIAHLNLAHFPFAPESDAAGDMVLGFLDEIEGFEHLIIDMRMVINPGNVGFFLDNLFRPNLSTRHDVNGFGFARSGYYNRDYLDNLTQRSASTMIPFRAVSDAIPVSEIISANDLPEAETLDLARMEYGFPIRLSLMPNHISRFDGSAFDGKIWLLTNRFNRGAAEFAARLSKNTGFATLVGERTGGGLGGPQIVVALPNTGIVFHMETFYLTDEYGRPFEAGTYPHHFNRDGLDALETVLELIAEGEF